MLKIGVIGAGHLGKIHLKLAAQSEKLELVGFFDSDTENSKKLADECGYKLFPSAEELIEQCDIVDVVTPTFAHFEYAKMAIKASKHIFIEKPIANSIEEAYEIIRLAKEYNVKGQVGHVERFNPAFKAAHDRIHNPMFIETHRLAEFNPRGTDVPVVLDLMIHDLDAILSIVKSEIKEIHSSAVAVISESPDIANARIEFENGCVANVTSSRISMKNMRKSRFFQKDSYISVDYLEKSCEVIKMKDAPENPGDWDMILQNAEGVRKQIYFDNPEIIQNNAILEELESFAAAVENNTEPLVTLQQATKALEVAYMIIEKFNK
ncbi:MAG: Gfo/Idh/MocA family oxidoreductase [Flavobacteriia bacterium]|nr:Gfo/Idh/MocA family oxidoreductase [Flavobacteriia bacterium]